MFQPKFKIYLRCCGHFIVHPKTFPTYKEAYAEVKKNKYKKFKIVLDNWPEA